MKRHRERVRCPKCGKVTGFYGSFLHLASHEPNRMRVKTKPPKRTRTLPKGDKSTEAFKKWQRKQLFYKRY